MLEEVSTAKTKAKTSRPDIAARAQRNADIAPSMRGSKDLMRACIAVPFSILVEKAAHYGAGHQNR